MNPAPAALPPVRSVPCTRPFSWLRRGWQDLWCARSASLAQGAALTLFSLLTWGLGRDRFGLLVGALSGFLVLAPVLAPDSSLFALWLALGSVLAAPIFASTVVSFALLLDRRIGLWPAVLTSWQVVLANPATMALWSLLILAVVLLGMAPCMLGHASWHAYRDLVDTTGLPEREPRAVAPGTGAEQHKANAS